MADIVRVKWLDHSSFSTTRWRDRDSVADLTPFVVDSVGFLIVNEPDRIVIAAHVSDSGAMSGEMCILRSCIKSMKVLRRA